jgi:hypothetical protein
LTLICDLVRMLYNLCEHNAARQPQMGRRPMHTMEIKRVEGP